MVPLDESEDAYFESEAGKNCAWPGVLFVGTAGFEPTTPCSQSRCATELRHVPLLVFGARRIPARPAGAPRVARGSPTSWISIATTEGGIHSARLRHWKLLTVALVAAILATACNYVYALFVLRLDVAVVVTGAELGIGGFGPRPRPGRHLPLGHRLG